VRSGINPSWMEFGFFWLSIIASAVFYVDKCMGDVKFFVFVLSLVYVQVMQLEPRKSTFPFSYRCIRIVSRLGDTSCYHRPLYIGLTFIFAE